MLFYDNPGTMTLTIRRRNAPTKDANGVTVPQPDTLITKTGCHAESQRPAETETQITVDTEIMWFFLPVDDDTRAITTRDAIEFDGRKFELRGPRVIERDVDGAEVQVWCVGEWNIQ
ncbi:head closure Hc1 [Mycobacterium phage GreaseLightnin]|uniref:Head-to-tail stopper n=5 Tax=Fishburnevirus TaxID=1983734 RepID=A0A482JI30_9CAUD|nr:head closure Hc1 [Mycobacterium phage Fishburne]YP_009964497.1 head closure Hc1 [Mycobacterium phage GreaseLightnin]YP_009964657.1 head closure Hc1 [Mycobacterium phage Phineas]YP_009964734.1 head closure Hc1 [Mycobacterium phage Bartholomew]YP_009964811.1 head closure Hc1 [Mycobacterium phage FirstPlacePfu]ASR84861.1 head-to-tail stopper [Mycobacterium phage StevieRay]QBI97945.1 head-to-tail stopper [Mycobacterium phage Zilizebeth]QDH84965.1 head-to-tail stopper [Mycobacterium phage HUHi